MKRTDEISIEEILGIVRRYFRVWFFFAVAGGAVAAIASFLAKPVYQAAVMIQMTPDSSQNLFNAMNPAYGIPPGRMETYVELAQSKTVLERVYGKLNPDAANGKREAVKGIRSGVDARIVGNTELIRITVRDSDPEVARDFANEVGNELVAMSIERKQKESRQIREFLDTQVEKVRDDLQRSEANLSPRAVRVNEEVYRLLLSKRHEANIAEHSTIGELEVVDTADLPVKPVRPRKAVNTLLGLIVGTMLGFAVAVWRHRQASGIENAEELEELSGMPVIGTIPLVKVPGGMEWFERLPGPNDASDNEGNLEPYRMLAANLELVRLGKARKIMLIASAIPGEGKTTTAASLGFVMAKEGRKVVVVEGDMRRPKLGDLWKLQGAGLVGVLSGRASIENAIVCPAKDYPNFHLLMAGSTKAHPTELLLDEPLRDLMGKLRDRFDAVLIDSGPILLTPDVLKFAGVVDAILLVVEADTTPRNLISRSLVQISRSETPVIGAILNKLSTKSSHYGYYYYRYYRHADDQSQ